LHTIDNIVSIDNNTDSIIDRIKSVKNLLLWLFVPIIKQG